MQFFACITDFIFVEDEPQRSDIIFVPGGSYPDAAEHAAGLYHEGYAPYIMPSGKYSILTGYFAMPGQSAYSGTDGIVSGTASESLQSMRFETECDYLCDILFRHRVPESAVIREDQATFTYENAIYSRKKTQELGLQIRRAILCCQAFHARRCLMYYQEQFPETRFLVCPVVTRGISRETWHCTREGIDTVLGELERCGGQFHEILYGKLPPERI